MITLRTAFPAASGAPEASSSLSSFNMPYAVWARRLIEDNTYNIRRTCPENVALPSSSSDLLMRCTGNLPSQQPSDKQVYRTGFLPSLLYQLILITASLCKSSKVLQHFRIVSVAAWTQATQLPPQPRLEDNSRTASRNEYGAAAVAGQNSC